MHLFITDAEKNCKHPDLQIKFFCFFFYFLFEYKLLYKRVYMK